MRTGNLIFSPVDLVPLPFVTGIKVGAVLLAAITAAEVLWALLSNVALPVIGLLLMLAVLSLAVTFVGLAMNRGKTEGKTYLLKTLSAVDIGVRLAAFLVLVYLGATSEWDRSATCVLEPQVAEWTHHLNLGVVGVCQTLQVGALLSLLLKARLLDRELKYRSLAHYLALY